MLQRRWDGSKLMFLQISGCLPAASMATQERFGLDPAFASCLTWPGLGQAWGAVCLGLVGAMPTCRKGCGFEIFAIGGWQRESRIAADLAAQNT